METFSISEEKQLWKKQGREIAVYRLNHPCSLNIYVVSLAPPPPRKGEVPEQPHPPAPFTSGAQGLFSRPSMPRRGRGQPGQLGGNPSHLLRETQQPCHQEGRARKPSSDRLADPWGEENPRVCRPPPPPPPALTAPARHSTAPLLRARGGSSPPPPSRRQAPATGARRGRPPLSAYGGRARTAALPAPCRRPPCCPPLRPSRQSPQPRGACAM